MTDGSAEFDRTEMPRHGVTVRMTPSVRRVVAPNPSAMTFAGTNTYLIGSGPVAVVDPGPPDCEGHLDALLDALEPGEEIEAILVTHRHFDHAAAVAELAARTGAEVWAAPLSAKPPSPSVASLLDDYRLKRDGIHRNLQVDGEIEDGQVIESRRKAANGQAAWQVRAVYTPGHLDDHMCFALEDEGVLLTGDHVMGWSSSIISPPEGSISAYLASLRKLAERLETGTDSTYLPGHGHAVAKPQPLLTNLARLRGMRELEIVRCLGQSELGLDDLLRKVYAELPETHISAARRSLLAHVVDLAERGRLRAERESGEWRFGLV